MALKESIEKQGNWLFKYRSFLPLIILLPGLTWFIYKISERGYMNPWWLDLFFLFIGFIGLGIRIFTVGFTPKGTSGRNTTAGQVAETLNTSGIYSMVRHPLYLGNFFMWLAPVLMISDLWFALFFCAFYWIYYERIMFAEEGFLRQKFGEQYMIWAEKTPAFIPNIINYKKSILTFSLRNVLKREYNGFFNMIAIMTSFRVLAYYIIDNKFYLDLTWIIIFFSGFLIFGTLKILKKFTKVLEAEGR
ncbi:MAG: isoprenylcysteine carboxylmethyltransferase family protein [Bacteroidales bacterium]|nr:isoprenylcysteine carboxylmethyltransferase family protein [Bacteroidales bacterium]MDD3860477.1 isoprenylcysteine carboxylmethyltransferase family protein [Bacteroidales bacterium]